MVEENRSKCPVTEICAKITLMQAALHSTRLMIVVQCKRLAISMKAHIWIGSLWPPIASQES